MSARGWRPADAASLDERVAGLVEAVPGLAPEAADQIDSRWRSWKELVAGGDRARWRRRLARIPVAPMDLARLLGPVRARPGVELDWAAPAASLLAALAADQAEGPAGLPAAFVEGPPIPFGPLFVAMVADARRRLDARVGPRAEVLTERATLQLERQLAWRLARSCEPTLTLEFSLYRAQRRTGIERLFALATAPDSSELYDGFIAEARDQGLAMIAARYPALVRSWTTLTTDWVEGSAELIERLSADAAELVAHFGLAHGDDPAASHAPLPRVESIQTELSDRHHGGRTVAVLRFEGGAELVYKPRNIDVEGRWTELLDWLAARGAPIDLRGLRVLPRASHGWVEVARAGPCETPEGFPRFYRRAGALLCLVHLLAGNDCHRENLIAIGEHPVLVDVETLMHPAGPPEDASDDAPARLARALQHSVLATAMLPHWSPMPAGGGYESGGIGPGGRLATTIEARVPQGRNTDELTHELRTIELAATKNVPFVAGTGADRDYAVADHHVDALVEGYEAMARFVVERRAALLEDRGPIEAFGSVPIRVLMRGTPVYERVRARSLVPEAMASGVARSIALESLLRPLTGSSMSAAVEAAGWAMVDEERAQLQRLDIPRFELRADLPPTQWRPDWSFAGLALARRRIAELDQGAIARQSTLIRASFEARDAARDRPTQTPAQVHVHASDTVRVMSDADLRTLAAGICARLEDLATHGAGDTATWLASEVMTDSGAYRLRPMGPSLYGGVTGVGLTLAAASVVLDDRNARDLSLAAVRTIRDRIERDGPPSRSATIGGVMGIASTAYGLGWMGHLLDDDGLIEVAATLALSIDERAITADRNYDLAGGSAGAILVLLAIDALRSDPRLIERARRCGEHLLASRVGQPGSWPAPSGVRLSGLAHGASGVAVALHRLGARLDEPRFSAAAREALAFERTLFHPDHGNWQDVRPDVPPGGPSFMNSWCNGAAGIGMARLWLPATEPGRAEELHVALQTTSRHAFGTLDHMCCGNVGRAELLLEAGGQLGDDELLSRSRQLVSAMSKRAEQRGTWALVRRPHRDTETAGLFRGLAGIAWHLLRQLAPDHLPALGVLEGPQD